MVREYMNMEEVVAMMMMRGELVVGGRPRPLGDWKPTTRMRGKMELYGTVMLDPQSSLIMKAFTL